MLEKQKQTVGDNSTAIQVNGNLVITPYHEIRRIFLDLFELNFPKIQKIAEKKAREHVEEMLQQLKKSFEKHKDGIDPDKFSDPFIQYEMQEIAKDVARRGEKSNIELLCELFSTIVSKDCPELIELVASKAREILPILAQKHIAYLSLEILVNEAPPSDQIKTITDLNESLSDIIEHIKGANYITPGDLQYLASVGAIETRGIIVMGIVPSILKSINHFKNKNYKEIEKLCHENNYKNISALLDLMNKCLIGRYQLMAVGRLIGWLNISRFSNVDLKNLF